MKTKAIIQGVIWACVALWGVACSDERNNISEAPTPMNLVRTTHGEEMLTISPPDLEIGLDEEAFRSLETLRTLNYELGKAGKMGIGRPALTEGQEVKLHLLFNYEGSTEDPLMARDIVFVWRKGKLQLKPDTYASIQLRRKANNQSIPHNSEEEKNELLSNQKKWYYSLVYQPQSATFDGKSMILSATDVRIYERTDDIETPSTVELGGQATQGKIDLGGFPFASPWVSFDMVRLLKNPQLTSQQQSQKYKLPSSTGLAPRGYFLMLSFQNQIEGNTSYRINKIKVKTQQMANLGTLEFIAPTAANLNPISYGSTTNVATDWAYDLASHNRSELLNRGQKGRYYFLWAMPTGTVASAPQLQVSVEGEAQGTGRTSYTFPWYSIPMLNSTAGNKGRTLLYTLSEVKQGPPTIVDNIYSPAEYITYHNYVKSEDEVRAGRIAVELEEHEWRLAQGVSTGTFYQSHSGQGNILRTSSWTPKANAVPTGRRWPTLTDWATVLPLVHSDRTMATRHNPNFSDGVLRDIVGRWWGLSLSAAPNFTKKVRRLGNELTHSPAPQAKGQEAGRTVYEIEGGKEIVNFHASNGSDYTMALGAEYILHTDNAQPNKVFYGRRFIGSHSIQGLTVNGKPVASSDLNAPENFPGGTTAEEVIAREFPENRLLSAWRYENKPEGSGRDKTLTIVVKFVLLGPSRANVSLETIGTEAWWTQEESRGNVRLLHLRMPRFHTLNQNVPHLTTSFYGTNGTGFYVDESAVWYENIENFTTNTNTQYYLKLSPNR